MEANQFVLICAVFIVVAAFMVSVPDLAPAPQAKRALVLTCRFDSLCTGSPCVKQAAPDLNIFAPTEDGWSSFSRADRPYEFYPVARKIETARTTYTGRESRGGISTLLTISTTGAMRFEQKSRDGALAASGEGFCRQPDAAAPKNGDKI
jgi:hypothetical protein